MVSLYSIKFKSLIGKLISPLAFTFYDAQFLFEPDPWWSSDINNAKMENLMFLLAGLMLLNVAGFCAVAHFYTYQDPSRFEASVCGQNKDISVEQNRELDDCTEEEERATNSGSNEAKGTDRLAALV